MLTTSIDLARFLTSNPIGTAGPVLHIGTPDGILFWPKVSTDDWSGPDVRQDSEEA